MLDTQKILLLLILLFFRPSYATITIDGELNETEWHEAQLFNKLLVVEPYLLDEPRYQTETLITSNESGIYIGIKNYQPIDTRNTDVFPRDQTIESDKVELMLDFDNNAITAYSFQLGAGGSIRDGTFSSESGFSNEWDGNWSGAVSSNDEYWAAEFLIPWDVVSMKASDDGKRQLNWYLIRSIPNETQAYANVPTTEFRQRFLNDFETISLTDYSQSSLQLYAYATARKNIHNQDSSMDAGLDLFWKSGNGKQLTATVNPDFGQIESDSLVVNFSATEIFFNERRPFFTENQTLFKLPVAYGLRVIHTRRIGSRPDIGTDVATDIDAAIKFTDNHDQFTYGVFAASESSGNEFTGRDYFAGRFLHKTNHQTLGLTSTYVNRPDINRKALTNAINHEYQWSENITQKSLFAHSNTEYNNDKHTGIGLWTNLEHQINDNQKQGVIFAHYGKELDVNDFGFLPRNNLNAAFYTHNLKLTKYAESSKLQQREFQFNAEYIGNNNGVTTGSSMTFSDSWQFKNASSFNWDFNYYFKAADDLISRGNGLLNFDSGTRLGITYRSNNANKLRYHGYLQHLSQFETGTEFATHIHPSYFFQDNYSVSLGVFYRDANNWLNWIEGNQFGRYQRKLLNSSLDFNANFSPKQELRFRLQWIAIDAQANAHYQLNSQGDLLATGNEINDFSLSNTALQIRYRYEIAPLSNIYVVYSRGASIFDEKSESVFGLFNPGFENVNSDNFLVKFRYNFF